MSDYDSVLAAALQLPDGQRLQLIEALWDSVPPDADAPFSDEWAREIQRRVAELDAGQAETVPWPTIREEAMARIGHGEGN